VTDAYSWTLLRVVPRVERGERINVGAVVFCRTQKFLGLELEIDEGRLLALDPELDLPTLRSQLDGLARVAAGDPGAGRVAAMDPSDRFGFIAAPSSTIVQPSPVHVGMTHDATKALENLMNRAVR
jgi:hypothetical protein